MPADEAALGSYEQYKHDTSIFMTWLSQAARVCGYSPPAYIEYKSQEEVDHAAATTQFGLPVKEIITQAKTIVGSKSLALKLPDVILNLAKRAIATRRQVTARFKALMVNHKADTSHDYFTKTLEEAVAILRDR